MRRIDSISLLNCSSSALTSGVGVGVGMAAGVGAGFRSGRVGRGDPLCVGIRQRDESKAALRLRGRLGRAALVRGEIEDLSTPGGNRS